MTAKVVAFATSPGRDAPLRPRGRSSIVTEQALQVTRGGTHLGVIAQIVSEGRVVWVVYPTGQPGGFVLDSQTEAMHFFARET